MTRRVDAEYGPGARNRLEAATSPAPDGARAALETFYYAFNRRDLQVLQRAGMHHHGSIDDPDALREYQLAVAHRPDD